METKYITRNMESLLLEAAQGSAREDAEDYPDNQCHFVCELNKNAIFVVTNSS